jgi:hypothetical protein
MGAKRFLSVWLIVLLAGACGGPVLIKPDKPFSIGDHYTVEPQIAWSRLVRGNSEIWTVDGALLQQLRFIKGIEDGDKLFPSPALADGRRDRRKPPFRGDMTPPEIREFFETSLSQAGAIDVRSKNLRPAAFGALAGFHFEFAFSFADGLPRRGLAAGAVKDKALHLIVYFAPEMYYFGRDRPRVDAIIRSIRMTE